MKFDKFAAVQMFQAVSAGMLAVMVLAFMTGFLPFFSPLLENAGFVWRIVYFGFWMCALGAAGLHLVLMQDVGLRRRLVYLSLTTVVMLGLTFAHPVTRISKNFIAITIFIFAFTVLSAATRNRSALRLGAWVVVFNACVIFVDIIFPVGFSNTLGRAGGFLVNPNDAALSLMLGCAATCSAVPLRWRYTFFALVGSAIFFTISRSTLLLSLSIMVLSLSLHFAFDRASAKNIMRLIWPDVRLFVLLGFSGLWLLGVVWSNDRFPVALKGSLGTLEATLETVLKTGHQISGDPATSVASKDQVALGKADFAKPTAELGSTNSVMARKSLLMRSLYAFETAPFMGEGLEAAYSLAPHNMFLLFAVAFGYPGVALDILLVVFLFGACGRRSVAVPLSVIAAMLVSHDLLMPALAAPIALGLGYALQAEEAEAHSCQNGFVTYVWLTAAAVIFATVFVGVHFRGQNLRYTLDASAVRSNTDANFVILVPTQAFSGILRPPATAYENVRLLENGNPLTPMPSTATGSGYAGKFALVERYALDFSPFDQSNPTRNGRSYFLEYRPEVHPLGWIMCLLLMAWGIAYSAAHRTTVRMQRRAGGDEAVFRL